MMRIAKSAALRGLMWIAIGGCAYGIVNSYLSPSMAIAVLQLVSFCG